MVYMYMYTYGFPTGSGATAVVQVARCLKNNMKVAIKRIDLERCGSTIEELQVSERTISLSVLSQLPLWK